MSVADPGTLTGPVTFLVRIAYPVASIPQGTPGTETWTSTLTPKGTATRTIVATSPGVLSVQLDSLGGASGPVDFAFGIPGTDGRGCYLTRSVRTRSGSSSFAFPAGRPRPLLRAPRGHRSTDVQRDLLGQHHASLRELTLRCLS